MSDAEKYTDKNNPTKWKARKEKKVRKEVVIKTAKIRGEAHINHARKQVPARVTGPDCRCTRLKCFENISEAARQNLLLTLNSLLSKNEQDKFLSGLISFHAPIRRRPRREDSSDDDMSDDSNLNKNFANNAVFTYKVRLSDSEAQVCFKAFMSIFGVTRGRIRRIQHFLLTNGRSPRDRRGTHQHRPNKIPQEVEKLIVQHIHSFKARQSHYSRRKNPDRLYLPETLSVKKMWKMFLEKYRINVTYKAYWKIFKSKFNISFGLPRSDTCSICDSLLLQINAAVDVETKQTLTTQKELHLAKADKFYEIKRRYKLRARQGELICLSFDYMQNLPLPHLRTGDVFFASQLWYYVFGVHDLGSNEGSMLVYDETVGRKGQNDVTSLLLHYFSNQCTERKDTLVLFSDGCPGQNKNYVMVRFLYFLVHGWKLFKTVLYHFPVRGHSRLPNDQDFSLIEAKKRKHNAEIQSDWDRLILSSRENPSPFHLVKMKQTDFFNIAEALNPYFTASTKPPMKLKGIRSLKISSDSEYVMVKHHYAGLWEQISVRNKRKLPSELNLQQLYTQELTIKPTKLAFLRKLANFVEKPENQQYYLNLQAEVGPEEDGFTETEDEDNSSGAEDV